MIRDLGRKVRGCALGIAVAALIASGLTEPAPSAEAASQSGPPGAEQATRSYPDFALQAPTVNTNPGPEYASWTRVQQGVSAIERTAKGRLWAAWSVGSYGHPRSYVVLVTSGDNGKTWSAPTLVIDPPGDVSASNQALWRDPLGRVWLFWRQAVGRDDGRAGVWAIISENPDLERPTWSRPQRLADGTALNKPIVLSSGEWLLPVAMPIACNVAALNEDYRLALTPEVIRSLCHDVGDRKGGSEVHNSVDRGKTWTRLGAARIADFCCEPMVVERSNRSIWMLARTDYGIGQSVSTDGGRTWGQSGPSGIRHPVTRFFLTGLKSGRLLLVRHNPPERLTRSHRTAYLSDDDGGSWSGALLLDARNNVAYPDGVEAANGTVYVIYDRERIADREILMATFTEDDVKQGKCVTSECRLQLLVNKAGD